MATPPDTTVDFASPTKAPLATASGREATATADGADWLAFSYNVSDGLNSVCFR